MTIISRVALALLGVVVTTLLSGLGAGAAEAAPCSRAVSAFGYSTNIYNGAAARFACGAQSVRWVDWANGANARNGTAAFSGADEAFGIDPYGYVWHVWPGSRGWQRLVPYNGRYPYVARTDSSMRIQFMHQPARPGLNSEARFVGFNRIANSASPCWSFSIVWNSAYVRDHAGGWGNYRQCSW